MAAGGGVVTLQETEGVIDFKRSQRIHASAPHVLGRSDKM